MIPMTRSPRRSPTAIVCRRSSRAAAPLVVAAAAAAVAVACTAAVAGCALAATTLPATATLPLAAARRRAVWLSLGLAAGGPAAAGIASAELENTDEMPIESMGGLAGRGYGKRRTRYKDYKLTPSGLQFKDVQAGKPEAAEPREGDTVVIDWEGYTINYFGRPFETRTLRGLEGVEAEPLRFKLGDGTVIKAIDEAVRSMREGCIRQLIVPLEIGYDDEKRLRPRPSTFSGKRALDTVMDAKGTLMDKTLLMNINLKRVYKPEDLNI